MAFIILPNGTRVNVNGIEEYALRGERLSIHMTTYGWVPLDFSSEQAARKYLWYLDQACRVSHLPLEADVAPQNP